MAEFKFEGLSPQRPVPGSGARDKSQKIGTPALDEIFAHSLDGIAKRRRVARPIGEENPRGVCEREASGGRGGW